MVWLLFLSHFSCTASVPTVYSVAGDAHTCLHISVRPYIDLRSFSIFLYSLTQTLNHNIRNPNFNLTSGHKLKLSSWNLMNEVMRKSEDWLKWPHSAISTRTHTYRTEWQARTSRVCTPGEPTDSIIKFIKNIMREDRRTSSTGCTLGARDGGYSKKMQHWRWSHQFLC